MKYMLLIYMAEDAMNEAEREQCYVDSSQICHDLASRGKFLGANPLQPINTAASVRVRSGERLVTDGPFAETREQLGGYFLIEVQDLDEALGVAARIPAAKKGTVEVRPVFELTGLPTAKDQP